MQADAMRAPDWYDDPEFPGRLRYWDGSSWTEFRAERLVEEPQQAPAPHAAPAAPQAARPAARPAAPQAARQPAPQPAPQPAAQPAPQPAPAKAEGTDTSFALVVVGVLAGAVALIACIVVVVVWFDSYNTGNARGEQARQQGVPPSQADAYCNALAKDLSQPGSAEGFWDTPWIWGCKRGLG